MCKVMRVVVLLAALSLVLAGQVQAVASTHEVAAMLIAVDFEEQTVSLKEEGDGKGMVVPVRGEALASLRSQQIKVGDKVIATCQDDDQGKHEAVTALRHASA